MISETVLQALRAVLQASPPDVVCAYLFGSGGRGDLRASSDLDVAILQQRAPDGTLTARRLDLASDLEGVTGTPVDLVLLNDAPVDLVHRVLRDGIVLLDRDKATRVRFEVNARNQFFDLQPILRRYRRTVLANLRREGSP